MYHIMKYCEGIKSVLNTFGCFVTATNHLAEFVSVANASYTLQNTVCQSEKEIGDIRIVGPRGGQYNVKTCRRLRTKS